MKIATYNVNGINGRLVMLLRWLEMVEPELALGQGVAFAGEWPSGGPWQGE